MLTPFLQGTASVPHYVISVIEQCIFVDPRLHISPPSSGFIARTVEYTHEFASLDVVLVFLATVGLFLFTRTWGQSCKSSWYTTHFRKWLFAWSYSNPLSAPVCTRRVRTIVTFERYNFLMQCSVNYIFFRGFLRCYQGSSDI